MATVCDAGNGCKSLRAAVGHGVACDSNGQAIAVARSLNRARRWRQAIHRIWAAEALALGDDLVGATIGSEGSHAVALAREPRGTALAHSLVLGGCMTELTMAATVSDRNTRPGRVVEVTWPVARVAVLDAGAMSNSVHVRLAEIRHPAASIMLLTTAREIASGQLIVWRATAFQQVFMS